MKGNEPGALPQGGGQGGAVDNIPCDTSMSNAYHVHGFVGIINNGTGAYSLSNEVALPDAIGIVNPDGEFTITNPDGSTIPNQEIYGDCFYYMHTHDASGLVHMEAPQSFTGQPPCGAQASPPYSFHCTQSFFTFGNLLDIWGVQLTPTNFGPLTGQVGVYGTSPGYGKCYNPAGSNACYTPSSRYITFADPTQWHNIPMYHLSVIWIVIGAQPNQPSSLPNIQWINGAGGT